MDYLDRMSSMSDPCAGLGVNGRANGRFIHTLTGITQLADPFLLNLNHLVGWSTNKAFGQAGRGHGEAAGPTLCSAGRIIPMSLQTRPWGRGKQRGPI